MSKKSLTLVTWGFPFGEKEQSFLRAEFDELVKHYQVTILTQQTDDPILYPIPEDVRVEQYSYRKNSGLHLLTALPTLARLFLRPYVRQELRHALRGCAPGLKKERLRTLLSFVLQSEQLKEVLEPLIEETNAEFVYTYWCYPITLTAAELKAKYPRLKVLTRFHGFDLYQECYGYGYQSFRKIIAEKCDRLVFVCEKSRTYFLEMWGQGREGIAELSYLGCRPFISLFTPMGDTLTLLSCAGMITRKRINLIIEALALLPKHVKVHWHHIGSGELAPILKEQAENLLSPLPHVSWKFWGQIANQELPALYQKLKPHLFITTASMEGGAPVSVQEIFSAGIPAIGSDAGGIPDLIQNGRTGYLLPENPTPENIAEAIAAFYTAAPEHRQAMSAAAYALWQEKFDAKKNAEQFVRLLEEM